MSKVTLRPEAETDIAQAIDWYESRATGLGGEFLRAVEAAIASVERNPHTVSFSPTQDALRFGGFPTAWSTWQMQTVSL